MNRPKLDCACRVLWNECMCENFTEIDRYMFYMYAFDSVSFAEYSKLSDVCKKFLNDLKKYAVNVHV